MTLRVPPVNRVYAAAAQVDVPTGTPRGAVTYDGSRRGVMWGSSAQADTGEYVPELLSHYQAVREYERISRKSHVASLIRGTRLPLHEFRWYIDKGKASDAMWALCAANLNLAKGIEGDDPDDLDGHLAWDEHLDLILDAPLCYGHAYFSIAINPRLGGEFDGAMWLDGAMPLPQNTLQDYNVRGDGSLIEVIQDGFDGMQPVPIPAGRLAAYVFGQRPGDYWGAPVLRDVYEAEVYRRVAVDVGMEGLDFGAIGTAVASWIGEGPEPPAGRLSAEAAAANYRGGGGVAMPAGYKLEVLVPGASGVNPLDWLKHMESKESNAFMSGVSELSTSGHASFALGDVLDDHRRIFYRSIAKFAAKRATQQLLRRIVDANEGPQAACPSIAFDDGSAPPVSQADLKAGVDSGAVVLSHAVIAANHKRLGLPVPSEDETAVALKPAPAPVAPAFPLAAPAPTIALSGEAATPSVAVTAAADESPFSRDPSPVEITAAVDFKGINSTFLAARDALVPLLARKRSAAMAALVADVKRLASKGDLLGLSNLSAGAVGQDAMTTAALAMAAVGAEHATAEASAQGVDITAPVIDGVVGKAIADRAQAQALALGSQLANSASQKALDLVPAGLPADSVAGQVAEHLGALTDANLSYNATSLLAGALGEGRTAGHEAADAVASTPGRYYGSSLLDKNTCTVCSADDGREFTTLEDATAVYPGGSHNVGCLGGGNCRCLVVQVFDETKAGA